MIEARASKSFAERTQARALSERRRPTQNRGGRAHPLTWLNLVCLDAPLVAISWQWLFARSYELPVAPGGTAALFLTAWLIYLADRSGDSFSVDRRGPTLLRQRFCLRYRTQWIIGTIAIAVADLLIVCTFVDRRVLLAGAAVAVCAFVYLSLNRLRPSLWRKMPLKEVSIGSLFAAGTIVPLTDSVPGALRPACLLLVSVCSLNCVCIAFWERALDTAQQRVSIATAFPRSARLLPGIFALVAVASAAFALSATGPSVYVCFASSTLLLAVLHFTARQIKPDTRTALADLALLTPVVPLLVS
ncbi:MAG: hypothetical protein H0U88_03240 [Chthoniobacterales bacterium]|nr:hypothetical protein [Chthoniobacterales bacterium]MDQ3120348.1 hypothetical protein [Verrucomicrobiota bacterium]